MTKVLISMTLYSKAQTILQPEDLSIVCIEMFSVKYSFCHTTIVTPETFYNNIIIIQCQFLL